MKTRAVIIKKVATNEFDELVTCYTKEYGKMTAIAKSILKPNSIQAMHLGLLNLVDFELINGRSIPIITGAHGERTYHRLKGHLPSLAVTYFFTEIIDRMIYDNQKDNQVWNFLVNLFNKLDLEFGELNSFNIVSIFRKKQLELLDILGYSPNLNECALCSKPSGNYLAFSIEAHGAICQDCFLSGHKGVLLKKSDLRSLESVLDNIYESLAGCRLNSLSFLTNVVKS